jgi:hypothetical protein
MASLGTLGVPVVASAQMWLGGTGNWFDRDKWIGRVPPNGDTADAVVGMGASELTLPFGPSVTLRSLTVGVDDVVNVSGIMSVKGGVHVDGRLTVGGGLSPALILGDEAAGGLSGTGEIVLAGGPLWSWTTLTLRPGLEVRGAGQFESNGSGMIINEGTVVADSPGRAMILGVGLPTGQRSGRWAEVGYNWEALTTTVGTTPG